MPSNSTQHHVRTYVCTMNTHICLKLHVQHKLCMGMANAIAKQDLHVIISITDS